MAKPIHVPVARRLRAVSDEPEPLRRKLVHPNPEMTTQLAIRWVAWDGKPRAADAPTSPRAAARGGRLQVDVNVREAFLEVAWLGAKPPPPTAEQKNRSVRAMLATFDFDKDGGR